jgi:hypothetical protein
MVPVAGVVVEPVLVVVVDPVAAAVVPEVEALVVVTGAVQSILGRTANLLFEVMPPA